MFQFASYVACILLGMAFAYFVSASRIASTKVRVGEELKNSLVIGTSFVLDRFEGIGRRLGAAAVRSALLAIASGVFMLIAWFIR